MKKRSPFLFAIISLVYIGIVLLVPFDRMFPETYFTPFQIEYLALTTKMTFLFLFGLGGILKYGLKPISGLSSREPWSFKYLNLIPIYLFLIGASGLIGKELSQVSLFNFALLLTACLMVGFAEEFIFRGFLQSLFLKKYASQTKGIFRIAFFPALFFGLSHFFNLSVNDNVPQVIVQVIYAVFIGFFFGVLLLKTNKLIPIAVTHGLINFFFLSSSLPGLNENTEAPVIADQEVDLVSQITASVGPLILFLPLFLVGLFLLRKVKKEHALKKLALLEESETVL
ncbi:CPBP family intramembrane glutamic endopeptidase [Spongiimicrobium salis]|uniref:CPBP family intramembrane glutamic endopeptidase n=1 Tax=Spongiimicrobium salis TaxID=1667022 RepID=UPI00374D4097